MDNHVLRQINESNNLINGHTESKGSSCIIPNKSPTSYYPQCSPISQSTYTSLTSSNSSFRLIIDENSPASSKLSNSLELNDDHNDESIENSAASPLIKKKCPKKSIIKQRKIYLNIRKKFRKISCDCMLDMLALKYPELTMSRLKAALTLAQFDEDKAITLIEVAKLTNEEIENRIKMYFQSQTNNSKQNEDQKNDEEDEGEPEGKKEKEEDKIGIIITKYEDDYSSKLL